MTTVLQAKYLFTFCRVWRDGAECLGDRNVVAAGSMEFSSAGIFIQQSTSRAFQPYAFTSLFLRTRCPITFTALFYDLTSK